MPEWSWWTGHLMVLKDHLDCLPPDVNVYYAMEDLVFKHHANTGIFLMDYWPMFEPVLMISSPEISNQVSNQYNLQKPDEQEGSFLPIIGGSSLITMNNDEWKLWRSLFSPGFSSTHMLDLVPTIVASVEIFCDILQGKAGREAFQLDELTSRLTLEIITKVTL